MFVADILPELKMAINNRIDEQIKYDQGRYMGVEACLSDHEVFRLNREIPLDEFGIDKPPEYVMFLEKCRNGAFGAYQIWVFLAFSEDDLEEVAKTNGVFSYDELCLMEAFEHCEEE